VGVGDVGDIVVGVGVGMATQTQLHQGTVPHPFMHTHKHSRTDALGQRCGPQRRTVANTLNCGPTAHGKPTRAAANVITNWTELSTDGLNDHSPESSAAQLLAALATHTQLCKGPMRAVRNAATADAIRYLSPEASGSMSGWESAPMSGWKSARMWPSLKPALPCCNRVVQCCKMLHCVDVLQHANNSTDRQTVLAV
jgi:hypothetical protein